MIALENLSRIGIGTYRMSIKNDTHFKTLDYAVDNGVNLIDTASNYINGNSERLIGCYVKQNKRDKIFIISKAGYIHGNDLETFSSHLNHHSCIKVQEDFYYSFEKTFLEKQIKSSLTKMNTDFLDGFLIHNPEYFLSESNLHKNEFYDQLNESLHYLEDLVKNGTIRYYGISSNKLPTREVNIKRVLEKRKDLPNFKLLQFPYNLNENEAVTNSTNGNLIDFCRENKILTFGNRPLTTTYKNKVLRIADYSDEIAKVDFQEEQKLFDDLILQLSARLNDFDPKAKVTDFRPINILIEKRKEIANPEAVDKIVYGNLLPFIGQLQFENHNSIVSLIEKLTFYWKAYSKQLISKRANILMEELVSNNILEKKDKRDFSLIACEKYLKDGINHILVGLRKSEYVDKLKPLF